MRELSLHILDIMQNSITAGATLIGLMIKEDLKADLLTIKISDNGQGMTQEEIEKVTDPFVTSRTIREVGLGLPLFKEATRRCDGEMKIRSILGVGTEVRASFKYSHIDRAPLGDLVTTLISLLATNPEIDFVYQHIIDDREFLFKTKEIKRELGEIKINQIQVLNWLANYLKDCLKELHGGD